MKLIAHRGLTAGPNKNLENQPDTIKTSLGEGFDVEIDLWVVNGRLYLGHDEPMYNITEEFITTPGMWVHAKSLGTLHWLVNSKLDINYFWHENDSYTLTSKGYIWAYPGKSLTTSCVMVMPEWEDQTLNNARTADCYAICSDYVKKLK